MDSRSVEFNMKNITSKHNLNSKNNCSVQTSQPSMPILGPAIENGAPYCPIGQEELQEIDV